MSGIRIVWLHILRSFCNPAQSSLCKSFLKRIVKVLFNTFISFIRLYCIIHSGDIKIRIFSRIVKISRQCKKK